MIADISVKWMDFRGITRINWLFGRVLSIILLIMLVGCSGSRRGVLSELPEPALRSGIQGSSVTPSQKPVIAAPLPLPAPSPSRFSNITVVLDPGHAGKDGGTPGCASAVYP